MNYVEQVRKVLTDRFPGLKPELVDLYTLLAFAKGEKTTLKDVHDAWSIWTNGHRADHHSLIPFDDLSWEIQELDRKYAMGIRSAARKAR